MRAVIEAKAEKVIKVFPIKSFANHTFSGENAYHAVKLSGRTQTY